MSTTVHQQRKELDQRQSGSLRVGLYWNVSDDSVEVEVAAGAGQPIRFAVAPERALYAYYHPYAYVAELVRSVADAPRLPAAA